MIGGEAATTFGWAWLAATIALALHVADEATHDKLPTTSSRGTTRARCGFAR